MSRRKQRAGESPEDYAAYLQARVDAENDARRRKYREDPAHRAERIRAAADRVADPDARAAKNEALRQRYATTDHGEAQRVVMRERRRDPVIGEAIRASGRTPAVRAAKREADRRRRALPEGHSGACELCGDVPQPRAGGARGLNQDHRHDTGAVRGYLCVRCNNAVAVLDLRFTDPDRFAALSRWSLRGAPVVPVQQANPKRRRRRTGHPVLFEAGE